MDAQANGAAPGTVPPGRKPCPRCGRPPRGRKANALFCSDRCKRRAFVPKQQRLPLPDVTQAQHYSPDMGQCATKDEGRRVKDCAKVLAVLKADPSRWWNYDALALAASVRPASCRTRVSNLSLSGVEFERRVVDGFREIRLGLKDGRTGA